MPFSLLHTLRSRWLALAVQVGLWFLLYLAIVLFDARGRERRDHREREQQAAVDLAGARHGRP